MTCKFSVGQKIVCVEARYQEAFLSEGAVYTVADIIGPRPACSFDGPGYIEALVLEEVSRVDGFDVRRFRPAVERGTEAGMNILRDILTRTNKYTKVPA